MIDPGLQTPIFGVHIIDGFTVPRRRTGDENGELPKLNARILQTPNMAANRFAEDFTNLLIEGHSSPSVPGDLLLEPCWNVNLNRPAMSQKALLIYTQIQFFLTKISQVYYCLVVDAAIQ